MELTRVAAECQFKALARLQRLGSPIVDAVVEGTLRDAWVELGEQLGVPVGITDAVEVSKALGAARVQHWRCWKEKYTNKSLFSFEGDPVGNRWLRPRARLMGDGDRIKALRLRTNLFPTRSLSHKHAADAGARLCRRCGKAEETSFHILQKCTSVHEPRCSRHNFIEHQIITKLQSRHPGAQVTSERLIRDGEGRAFRPDIVLSRTDKVFILDVAVTWDATPVAVDGACTAKEEKYRSLVPVFSPKPVEILGLAFGARGLVGPKTRRAAKMIGLTEGELGWLAARTVVGSIICLNRFAKIVAD